MKSVRGSLTVEASIMIPMLLFLLAGAIRISVEMYLECRDMVVALEAEEEPDTLQLFYLRSGIEDIAGDGDSLY